MLRAGMIGLGAMGAPMAANILGHGFPLTVWARRRESAESLLARGAEWADSPAALADVVDVLVLSVTNSPDVEALVAGDQGILAGAREGLVVVDTSTIAPDVSRAMARRCAGVGAAFLDAPVSGGTQGAEAGTLTVMVGGDAEALERVRPVMDAFGGRVIHAGPSGAGEVVKLVNNILVGVIAAATAEALVLGARAGADVGTMAEVVGASAGASWQLANQFPLRVFNGSFRPGFMTDLLIKDLDLALDLGAESDVPLAVTALARQLYGASRALGHGRDDYTAVIQIMEAVAGVKARTS